MTTGATNYDQIFFSVNGQSYNYAGVQLGVKVSNSPNVPSGSTPDFYAFCVDVNHSINLNQPYQTAPTSISSALPNGAALAYLYNTFNSQVGNPLPKTQAAALQLALWEVEYGKSFTLSSVQDFGTSNHTDVTSSVQALAKQYISSIPCSPCAQATYYTEGPPVFPC